MRRPMLALAAVLTLAVFSTAEAQTAPAAAPGKDRVLLLLGTGFNVGEFHGTYFGLRAAGYKVDVASPTLEVVEAGSKNRALDWKPDLTLKDVKVEDYVGLAIPGGYSPGNLEKFPEAIAIVQGFAAKKKPISAICHGPRLLMRAGVMKDRVGTSLWKVKDELGADWIKQGGVYFDLPVVEDGEIVTSRYPNDIGLFAAAMVRSFERHGGLAVPEKQARVLVVGYGVGGPEKWVFTGGIEAANVKSMFVGSDKDLEKVGDAKSYDVVVVFKPKEGELSDGAKKLIEAFGAGAVRQVVTLEQPTLATAGDMVASVVAKARPAAEQRPAEAVAGKTYDAMIYLEEEQFDPLAYIAAEAWLRRAGREILVTSAAPGAVRGAGGYVALAQKQREGALQDGSVRLELRTVGHDGAKSLPAVLSGPKEDVQSLQGVIAAAREAGKADPASADVLVLLAPAFDENAVVGTAALLQAEGKKVAYVAAEKGEVTGMRGLKLQAVGSYREVKPSGKGMVVLPGNMYPESEDGTLKDRVGFAAKAYGAGATLLVFGVDSYYLAKEGGLTIGKDWKWAGSDQLVWSFKDMGGYSNAAATKTAERLYTAKSGEQAGALLRTVAAEKKE